MHKKILFLLGCFSIPFFALSQKVSKDDPTYVYIDYANNENYFDWSNGLEKRTVSFDTISNPKVLHNTVALKVTSDQFKLKKYAQLPMFLLDTVQNKYYGNPLIFKKLNRASGVFGPRNQDIAILQESFWPKNKKEFSELAYIFMRYSILEVYSHLNAEIITLDYEKNNTEFQIQYKCLWHYCTNDCYDPVYKFKIVFSENDRSVSLQLK